MAKVVLDNLTTLTNESSAIAIINNNNDKLETVIETILSRDGTSPNAMADDLDMNSNRILNLPNPPVLDTDIILKGYADDNYGGAVLEGAQQAAEDAADAVADAEAAAAQAAASALVAQDAAESILLSNIVTDTFTAGVGFTAGSTTALTLSVAPGSENSLTVCFDGLTQHRNDYSVAGTTLTFSSAITVGTNEVQVTIGDFIPIGVPSDGTVSTAKINDLAVTTAKIADSNVTTAKIADANVTTNKIANLNVTTGKIADDAVTLAKIAAGTAGNLITYDASGNPAAVATGTANQVLTSNGAGAAPTFQTLSVSATGRFLRRTVYTSGSGTWNRGVGTLLIHAQAKGGGGAGGGALSVSGSGQPTSAGSGGGEGGFSELLLDVTSISSLTYTIPSAAAGVSGGTGNDGGTVKLESSGPTVVIQATGGKGGAREGIVGTLGGIGSVGGFNLRGACGNASVVYSVDAINVNYLAGNGGGQGGGNGISVAGTGIAGVNGGGGGGAYDSANAARIGGAGGVGYIIIDEYS